MSGNTESRNRLSETNLKFYHYYDAPDGEDLFGKLLNTTSLGAAVGLAIGTLKAYEYRPYRVALSDRMFYMAKYAIPFSAVPAAFTLTTFYATRLRQKDDPINYIYGGIASGLTAGAFLKSPSTAIICSFLFSFFGYFKKDEKLNNRLVNIKPYANAPPNYRHFYNFGIMDYRPGNWTSQKQD